MDLTEGSETSAKLNLILHQAFEDGPDRGFRNVGKTQSDAGEIPKRKHTSFRTRRKSEIKNGSVTFANLNHLMSFAFSDRQVLEIWRQLKIYGGLA
jgi:hypothetical protein